MKKLVFLLIVSFMVIACSENKGRVPGDILPKKKMREVMWDMIRAGEFLHSFVLFKDSTIDKAAKSQEWYDKVYRIHNISQEEFERSYTYYNEHPLLMRELLDSLANRQMKTRQYGQGADGRDTTITKPRPSFDELRKRMSDTLNRRKFGKPPGGKLKSSAVD